MTKKDIPRDNEAMDDWIEQRSKEKKLIFDPNPEDFIPAQVVIDIGAAEPDGRLKEDDLDIIQKALDSAFKNRQLRKQH